MNRFKLINSYIEIIILIFFVIYLLIKRYPIQIIIMGAIAMGICLYLKQYFTNRLISKNKVLMKQCRVQIEAFEENKTNRNSNEIDENIIKEEIRVLKKVIAYAESCSQFYKYEGIEAEGYIDEKCKPFVDLVAPLLAVTPKAYQKVIITRPSLEPYAKNRIEEYVKNRPALDDVKAELNKAYSEMSYNQGNTMSDFNIDNYVLIIVMIDKYGFSQELLSAASSINQDLTNIIFKLYDSRLRSIENHYDYSYECYKDPENAWQLR